MFSSCFDRRRHSIQHLKVFTTSLALSIALTACGSGDNGTNTSNGTTTGKNGITDLPDLRTLQTTAAEETDPSTTWVNVTGTTIMAQPNKGYVANNPARVTITLPVSPVIGDVIQVTGAGAGGWMLAQNANQSIIVKGIPNDSVAGAVWVARDSRRNWAAVASSADGSKLIAAENRGYLYTSTDSGANWIARDESRYWWAVASSSDGTKLLAAEDGGQLYTSSNSGVSWTARPSGSRNWQSVASSADGTKLIAADNGGQIYTSSDSGASWIARDDNRNWVSVAASADASKLIAAALDMRLYFSTDSGATWIARGPALAWRSVASSADGSKLIAADTIGFLYTSNDAGVTWAAQPASGAPQTSLNYRGWNFVASSANGATLLASARLGEQLYVSSDSGVTWTARDDGRNWVSIATSSDGTKLIAADYNGRLYTSTLGQTTPGINGSLSGGQFDVVSLQYLGNNTFSIINFVSASGAFKVK
jgi:hypothetical protein